MKQKNNYKDFVSKKYNKTLRVIKISTLLIYIGTLNLLAESRYSHNENVSLGLANIYAIENVILEIERTTDHVFIYNEDVAPTLKNEVNVEMNDQSLNESEKEQLHPLSDSQAVQQPPERTISGKVTDIYNEPLPGVTIIIKGTTVGTVSTIDGDFSLRIPSGAEILQFSFVGMLTQEIQIGEQNTFSIKMEEASIGLEEVVAVGYATQKKESVVGSIVQTTSKDLKRTGNVTDLKQALTGQLPGVTTIVSSGEPGGTGRGESATNIYIRGQNTWNGGEPLILVDGAERDMHNIDVSEVESISVLKDASATAVFGVKGANGVILITTKRGATGKPSLSFSYNSTAKILSKVPKQMDSYDGLMVKNEAIEREVVLREPSWSDYTPYEIVKRYKSPQNPEYAEIYPNVDWEKAMFSDVSMSHRATLNVQGGTDLVNYFGSLSYLHEGDAFKSYENNKGYKPNFDFNRFNFRSNLDFKLTKTTNLKINLAGYYSNKNTNFSYGQDMGGTSHELWQAIYGMPPDAYLPQYDDGRWGYNSSLPPNKPNPVAMAHNLGVRELRTIQLNSDFTLDQNLDFITKGLNFSASLFYDNSVLTEGGIFDNGNSVSPDFGNTPLKMIHRDLYTGPNQDPREYTTLLPSAGTGGQFDWVYNPWQYRQENLSGALTRRMVYQLQINYARKFNLHNIGAMGVFKRDEYASGNMFKNYREDWVFRTTYDYDSKYLLEMNGAYNGSEQFGPGYRFDFFPSVAAGWNVANEKFFNVSWINNLKLRYSIGLVGDDRVSGGRWLYSSAFSYGGVSKISSSPFRNSPYTWYSESTVGNPNIRWEKALKNNLGLELGLLDNLILFNYDYFTEDRTDILLAGSSRNIPPYFGATPPSANLGHVKSSGHEIELKFDNRRISRGFHYWASLALTHTENEVLDRDDPELLESYMQAKGYPIGQSRSHIRAGFYNNWDEVYGSVPTEVNDLDKLPGFYNTLDFNADGIITGQDNVPFGYPVVPQNSLSISLGGDYKGFSAMVQLYGVNNASRLVRLKNFDEKMNVVFDHVHDYWSKDNQDATSFLPRWQTQAQNIGDYYLYDASYIRLKTVEVAYTFQDKWVENVGLSTFRLFVNGNNLFLWTKLPDDREANFGGGSDMQGAYPTVKRINFGIDLTF